MATTDSPSKSPQRAIFTDEDLRKFRESPVRKELLKTVAACGQACSMAENAFDPQSPLKGLSAPMAVLHGSLTAMVAWDIPPTGGPTRFGNPAFRVWHERLQQRGPAIVAAILSTQQKYPQQEGESDEACEPDVLATFSQVGVDAATSEEASPVAASIEPELIVELVAYLDAAFGHPIRLDYGTGHECSFQVFLYVLMKLHCFGSTSTTPPTPQRLKAITLSIWSAYLNVTRHLQTIYMLEPAGSHGVWGLDDYHCLPFYYGACQMLQTDLDHLSPSSIHDKDTLRDSAPKLLYFGCIQYIQSIKRGVPFFECSPMLNDISHIPGWKKVSTGLLKMFEGEVLNKRQVVQHFVFGEIFKADWTPSQSPKDAPTATFRSIPSSQL